MARGHSKLSVLSIQKISKVGRISDGNGLYLQVTKSGSKSWIFRYMKSDKAHEMGLGPFPLVPLAEARIKALDCRRQLLNGIDPLALKAEKKRQEALEKAKEMTFEQCANAYIESNKKYWKNAKHIDQWRNTLATYAHPVIGKLSIQAIDTALVQKVLEPIWESKTETAGRLRGRIESILDWAIAREFRDRDNPARWRGHLDKLLPSPKKIKKVNHHAALDIPELYDFIQTIRGQDGIAPRALEFLILTAARTGEALGAEWEEIDFKERVWTVPAERMKAGKIHRVPLSERAIAILNEMQRISTCDYIFPGRDGANSLSNMSLLVLIRRRGLKITSHGFRSVFKDWASEYTDFPNEVSEMALAHKIKNHVEAAYRRGELFLKRRKLMEKWAIFCETPFSNDSVIQLLA